MLVLDVDGTLGGGCSGEGDGKLSADYRHRPKGAEERGHCFWCRVTMELVGEVGLGVVATAINVVGSDRKSSTGNPRLMMT